MAHSKSAEKRNRQNRKARLRNRATLSGVRSQIKKVHAAIEGGDPAKAAAELLVASQRLDKAAKNRTLHPNKAARDKSRLAKRIHRLSKPG